MISISRKFLKYLVYFIFLPLWWLQILIPRNKKVWVFGCWYGMKYSDNAKNLFEYILKTKSDLDCIWLTKKPEVLEKLISEGKNGALTYSLKGIYYSLRAGFVIISSGKQDVNPFFIHGAKIINTWHGAPMKQIGRDDHFESDKLKYKILRVFFPFFNEYTIDAIVSTSDAFSPLMCSAFNLKLDQVICSGYPRNDIFFSHFQHHLIDRWNEKFLNPRKIFYLPTFRDHSGSFKPFENYLFNETEIDNFLRKTNSILVTKGHFVDKAIGRSQNVERIIHLNDTDIEDLNSLLKDFDILITDYSGVYFDFLLTKKPIVFAPFDLSDYTGKNRQLYFNYNEVICGPIAKNWNEIIIALEKILDNDEYKVIRNEKDDHFNKFHDGNNSERLLNGILSLMN